MELEALRAELLGLSAYRALLDHPVMQRVSTLLNALHCGDGEGALKAYTDVFCSMRQYDIRGLGQLLHHHLRYDPSPYGDLVSRGGEDGVLRQAARRDVETLTRLAGTDCALFRSALAKLLPEQFQPMIAALPSWENTVPFTWESLEAHYALNGDSIFALHKAFLWEGEELIHVRTPDIPVLSALPGYEHQREEVITNTRALLAGKLVNNVLLYGPSGTGKSATVKSLLGLPGFEMLRIIELQKEGLSGIPKLVRTLADKKQKFILFIDDLAFDRDDKTYSLLKSILEGGVEPRPSNVAIYATSNRRHLVRQTFSDRMGDEVDRNETIEEKTSLADRFGLRILFDTMTKAQYLELAETMARQAGISLASEQLRASAATWEVYHQGFTPRTAQQFVLSLLP